MSLTSNSFISSFQGLSREVWWLSVITLINRAGTMVIPFLSLYLTEEQAFSKSDVGWLMSAFGLGSVVGTWLGGQLTDRTGAHKVMIASLLSSGLCFITLQYVNGFLPICAMVFLVMLTADMFRPAMFVALSAYSKPENKTRSVTLIRLAINLGFSVGPAIGGLIIHSMGYDLLFWIDGISCFLALALLMKVLNPKKSKVLDMHDPGAKASPYQDASFWIFFAAMLLFGVVFLQLFSTVPIYYSEVHLLSELQIGLLMGMNGFVIFVLEMPLVRYFETKKSSQTKLMIQGVILCGLSYLVLVLTDWPGILVIGMLFITIGEMVTFPFSNAYAMNRSKRGKQGQYMALYAVAFSVAHIVGHNSGFQLIDEKGYDFAWNVLVGLSVVAVVLLLWLGKREKAGL
ncbi:MAG: MFS transporter [Flavobacteriales bacterium]|nr:MFS transporter [Flavobacteriales bacterium]MDG1779762.1 MFS transporter [Flavobacteriales bacterium]MDG2245517.1 MFS transporter [Flavobacteriales bacterium]